ncbi:MAG TPA: 5-formyltetrahydrofolate cyclo-ligase, partial [Verrucomicrobiae bacterium]|nr:5-formyltetrahydrofolate cyclo-ligase [Verrucomicrobiae bacterium]
MQINLQEAKDTLRSNIRRALATLSPDRRRRASAELCVRLKNERMFKSAGSLLFFAPLADELNLWPLFEETLAAGKVAALPCYDADRGLYISRRVENLHVEIVSGRFGIREPSSGCVEIPLDELEVILVPGVAFDPTGNRLGRGKGYYDRLLQNFAGKKIGVAFDEQLVEKVPHEKLDVRMDLILTPT